MVLEYLPTFTRTKSPSFVGKYTSTMVRIWGTNQPKTGLMVGLCNSGMTTADST